MKTVILAVLGVLYVTTSTQAGTVCKLDSLDPAKNSAWFLGPKKIRYCIQMGQDFGIPLAEAQSEIDRAFKTWQDYIEKKEVNLSGNSFWAAFPPVHAQAQLQNCDGTEDLTFYLGKTTPEIQKEMKRTPIAGAFSKRIKRDVQKNWSKGYVWIAPRNFYSENIPNWNRPKRLLGVLLHQIGHVLGNRHQPETIMDENRVTEALGNFPWSPAQLEKFFGSIDDRRELHFCPNCEATYDSSTYPYARQFKRLTGKSPNGKPWSKIKFQKEKGQFEAKVVYIVGDNVEKFQFPLTTGDRKWPEIASRYRVGGGVFKKYVNPHPLTGRPLAWSPPGAEAAVLMLQMETRQKEKIEFIIERNMGLSPVSMQVLDGDYIFSADTHQ